MEILTEPLGSARLFAPGPLGYVRHMKFSEADNSGGALIDAYGSDGILIDGRRFTGGLAITPRRVYEGWGPTTPADLTVEHLDELLDLEPGSDAQVLVLGTGATQIFPDPALYFSVVGRGIGFEVMDTGAACRTYNILISEGRRVVAGLLPWGS